MEKPFSVTTGMVGGGFYNRNSAPQMSAIDHVMPSLEDAIGGISFNDGAGARTLRNSWGTLGGTQFHLRHADANPASAQTNEPPHPDRPLRSPHE